MFKRNGSEDKLETLDDINQGGNYKFYGKTMNFVYCIEDSK